MEIDDRKLIFCWKLGKYEEKINSNFKESEVREIANLFLETHESLPLEEKIKNKKFKKMLWEW